MPVVEYPKVEINFTPPSHVLKIVEKAKDEEGTDWSEDEPVYVLKDGKKGTYIMKNQKYFLAETVQENKKKRLRKKLTTKKKEQNKHEFKEVSQCLFERVFRCCHRFRVGQFKRYLFLIDLKSSLKSLESHIVRQSVNNYADFYLPKLAFSLFKSQSDIEIQIKSQSDIRI